MDKHTFKTAFKVTLPVMAGYIVLGIGFGILLESKGYGVLWALLMSTTIYAGSMQYVAVDILSGGASLISAAVITLAVNARHLFYGISMTKHYSGMGKLKNLLIFQLTDETYSLLCTGEIPEACKKKEYFLWVSILDQLYWIIGSVLGGIIGTLFEFNSAGIEFAMTALFIVIFTDQWMKTKDHASAVIGVVSSVVCLIIFGSDNFIIPSMITILILLFVLRHFRSRGHDMTGGEKEDGDE
jgi:4-azaleucine resistance transporter AzlC